MNWLRRLLTNAWMADAGFDAQMAHVLAGCLAVAVVALFWPGHGWYAVGGMSAFAFVKEYGYDAAFEIPKQTFWDNTEDCFFYHVGIVIGVVVALLSGRF